MAGAHESGSRSLTPSRLRIVSLGCFALGAWLRVDYALFHHHLRHRATSDALLYLERAEELLQRGAVPNLPATIWPPGTSALWAALSAIDPSLQLTAAWNAAASMLVMPLTAALAGLLAGPRAAWIALAIAALHPGFVHYAGFGLAEQPFQLAIAVAMYLTLSALVRLEAEPLPVATATRPGGARGSAAAAASDSAGISSGAAAGSARASSDAGGSAAESGNTAGSGSDAANSNTQIGSDAVRGNSAASSGASAGGALGDTTRRDPPPTGHYIQAEVVIANQPRASGRRGRLGTSSPGGGSAQGKWFGRFSFKSEPPPAPEPAPAARRGFIGRGAGDQDTPATSARRSAFADRGKREPLGRASESESPPRAERERAGNAADEAAARRPVLPFKAGASRGTDAGAAAAREAWKGELDPNRPAGDLLDNDTPPDPGRDSLAAVLATDSGRRSPSVAADSGDLPADAAARSAFRSGRPTAGSAAGGGDAEDGETHAARGARGSSAAIGAASGTIDPAAGAGIPRRADGDSRTRDGEHADSHLSRAAHGDSPTTGVARGAADSGYAPDTDPGRSSRPDHTALHGTRFAAHALAGTGKLWLAGAAIGCCWSLAALIRPNALPVAAAGALALLVFSRKVVPSRAYWTAAGSAVAVVLALVAAAHRCSSTADGHFCLVSNNTAMNVALGQAGPVYGLEFRDSQHPERSTTWVAPSLIQHGYQGLSQVPASVYDSERIWSWVADRFTQDPLSYVVRAIGNIFDLFNLAYWPDEFGRYSYRASLVARQAWSAAVLIPAVFALFALARNAFGPSKQRPVAIFVLGSLAGLLLSAALSLGESRYRIPFDGLLIGLASAVYARAGHWHTLGFVPAEELAARRWASWSQVLAVSIATLIALTHPDVNLGLILPQRGAALPNRGRQDWATAADFAVPHATGSAWNGPGTYVWQCHPDCGELQVRLGGRRRARQIHVSVDHNDRYRLLFYRSGQLQAYADIAPAPDSPAGLRSTAVDVPKAASAGFDAIGVQPLYGDGGYSIGHLILE